VFFQLPWLPELLIRGFGFAGLRQRLLNEPVYADAFDEASVKVYRKAGS
jgi:hypothetical protein